jgi:hypothetical protein
MAMGTKRARQKQEQLFYASERAEAPGHPFYEQLNSVLHDAGFDHISPKVPAFRLADQRLDVFRKPRPSHWPGPPPPEKTESFAMPSD